MAKNKIKPKELWSLDCTIAKFVLPRLKAFKKSCKGCHPGDLKSHKEWKNILKELIWLMKITAACDFPFDKDGKERYNKACKLLGEYFNSLWT
jgi:hypothetical protein